MSYLKKSPWIIHYDGSSCNGCDIEVLACLTPVYDVERLGIINTGNPKHADIFVITGSVNEQNKEVIQNIYSQMPEPKVVVAIGICACSGGIFAECYNVLGGIDKVIPVDVYVPGCAARPESIIDGIAKGLAVLDEKQKKFKAIDAGLRSLRIKPAKPEDAAAILELQKNAYQSEAEIYSDNSLHPLTQTLSELQEDFKAKTFLKAVIGDQIIGAARAYMEGDTCHVGRLIVAPRYQGYGVARRLMNAVEQHFHQARRFEGFVGHNSKKNIFLFGKMGYKPFKTEKVSDKRSRVYMEKIV
jgi:ech hydrogenase subunit C